MILEYVLNRNTHLFAPRGIDARLPFRVNLFQYETPPFSCEMDDLQLNLARKSVSEGLKKVFVKAEWKGLWMNSFRYRSLTV